MDLLAKAIKRVFEEEVKPHLRTDEAEQASSDKSIGQTPVARAGANDGT